MSFSGLLAALQGCNDQPYYLEKKDHLVWTVALGEPEKDKTGELQLFAQEFMQQANVAPLSVPELDLLQSGIKNLTLEPKSNALVGLFKQKVQVAETAAYKCFEKAIEKHIECASLAHFDSSKQALTYLVVQNNDLVRFARLYRAIYSAERPPPSIVKEATKEATRAKFETEMRDFIAGLCAQYPFRSWLLRIKEDPEWPCSLVPNAELCMAPKLLDLKGCDSGTIGRLITAHLSYNYSQLMLVLSGTQDDVLALARDGYLDEIVQLDLRACSHLVWKSIEGPLAKLKSLESVSLPSSLVIETPVQWSSEWKQQLKTVLQPTLTRLMKVRQSRHDFTYVSDLMRGIRGRSALDNKNRVQVNFLLGNEKCLLELAPLSFLSASGIQKTTAETVTQVLAKGRIVKLGLSYCPLISKAGFRHLFETVLVEKLFLWGCSQIDDSYFVDHPLLTQRSGWPIILNLTATSVTEGMIRALCRAQPMAEIYWDKNYLASCEKIHQAIGVDRQGLSDQALYAVLHLKYTGYFSQVTPQVAMELILSPLLLLREEKIRRKLKEYCRYILQINVDRQNVGELYVFARSTENVTLQYICRIFIDTFFSPDVPELWQQLSFEEKENFAKILKEPLYGEPDLSFSEDILYFGYVAATVDFAPEAAPLNELIVANDIFHFVNAYMRSDIHEREKVLENALRLYPQKKWLQFFQANPQKIAQLAKQENGLCVVDLCGVSVAVAVEIIKAFQEKTKLELILDLAQDDLIRLANHFNKNTIIFLDLRQCKDLVWFSIQPYLSTLPGLCNVLFPANINIRGVEFRPEWSESMVFRLSTNIYLALALQGAENERKKDWEYTLVSQLKRRVNCVRSHDLYSVYSLVTEMYVANTFSALKHEQKSVNLIYGRIFMAERLTQLLASAVAMEKLTLFGCAFVDDSYFSCPLPKNLQEVDLRGTKVSRAKVQAFRASGITVLYDDEYLSAYTNWETVKNVNWTALSQDAFAALMYFNYTGYYPIIALEVALELLECEDLLLKTKWRLQNLQEHCLRFLVGEIATSNVAKLYQFAKNTKNDELLFICQQYIELYCNPSFTKNLPGLQRALFKQIVREPPLPLCNCEQSHERSKVKPLVFPKIKHVAEVTANLTDKTAEDDEL